MKRIVLLLLLGLTPIRATELALSVVRHDLKVEVFQCDIQCLDLISNTTYRIEYNFNNLAAEYWFDLETFTAVSNSHTYQVFLVDQSAMFRLRTIE